MAKFLFAMWPFAGHVHPALAIGIALRERGHEVAYWSGGAAGPLIEGERFSFFPFTRVDEEKVTRLATNEFPWTPSRWQRIRTAPRIQAKFREWLLDTIPDQVADLDAILTEWRPDAIVCDLSVWGPFLILHESRQIPVAVLSVQAACILPGPDAPMWGQGVPRPRTAWQRWRSRAAHSLLHILSAPFRAQVNAMRGRYGLPAIDCSVTEYAAHMPLYLVPSTPEYDYQRRDLPPSVRYVGPCLWDRSSQSQPPAWIDKLPTDQPLVCVTEPTIGTTEPFLLKAAAEALADLPVQVVMTAGSQRNPSELGIRSAPNVRVESYVPHSYLLPRMSVMVTPGGSGGVLAALGSGVPMVIVPTEWDRPENAQRVVEAGAGLRIPAEHCTAGRLRAAVQQVLQDPSYRNAAQRLSVAFSKYKGPRQAAGLLESLALASGKHDS
ncbi:MAG TPA: nucleotide disphospho-sugar-binding domain-containing protein [Bryobacteraceae bacterium]|nr:nucleotide disphospho-sugar-binding domain-containing protein [Bryobacteraceae bacterium]